ncbi:MAG: alpha/beta fold hydrolase [Ornithinibacter sp.]
MPSRTTARRAASRAARLPGGAVRHRVRLGGGTDVHVVEWPAGPAATGTVADGVTVVLAHGWTLSHESWLPVVELLRARFGVRVVAFDQPGHGLSTPESRAPTVHELGEVLHRVLTALAPTGPLVLAGHSMGGMTIMAWAADHADELAARVRGVVFVATSAKVGEDRLRLPLERAVMRASALAPRVAPGRLMSTRAQTRLLYGRGAARETVVPGVTLVRHTSLPTLGRYFLALQQHDETEALQHLGAVPTRVLVGTADRLTPVSHARALADGIRGAQLTVLPGLGHMLTYEAPDVVAHAIGDSLSAG